jgi:hypothetical protein
VQGLGCKELGLEIFVLDSIGTEIHGRVHDGYGSLEMGPEIFVLYSRDTMCK